MIAYAHSAEGQPPEKWQTLEEHSRNVAELAAKFAAPFGSSEAAKLLGWVHDMGKATKEFQAYLAESNEVACNEDDEMDAPVRKHGPDHSTFGAQWLDRSVKGLGRLLAYASAGHHSGIPDGISTSGSVSALSSRLEKDLSIASQPFNVDVDMRRLGAEAKSFLLPEDGFVSAFYLRMLYSTLVDADFIDTEQFMDEERGSKRANRTYPVVTELLSRLERRYAEIDRMTQESATGDSEVVRIRNEVRADCCAAAELDPGLFTLRVPTGGGKTLSSMLFALRHAVKHQLERVIVVIPFTSIIEQTADVYRAIFGEDNVLEHHCNVDLDSMPPRLRLATENWDAPIVVTTNVQFFESLFANRSSRCRKLHNLARSVVILDEAQGFPTDLLKPCLKALNELVSRYGTSIVLSTATLPVFFDASLLGSAALAQGDCTARDIVPASRKLEERLRRVEARRVAGKITDDKLLEELCNEPCALVIVSTRRHARELYLKAKERFPGRTVRHLSAQMCGHHRSDVLAEVKNCISSGERCLLVSTQLIEAGVDIDFPCVCRELAGVDSLVQAAGRCNREGRLRGCGRFIVFESSEYDIPSGYLRIAAQKGSETISLSKYQENMLGEESVAKYFTLLYADVQKGNATGMDKYLVLGELLPNKRPTTADEMFAFKFRELGEKFKLIDTCNCSVIIPYGEEGRTLCEQLRTTYAPSEQRRLARKLQRYAVSLYGDKPMDRNGNLLAEKVHDCYWVMTSPEQYYSSEFGVLTEPQDVFLQV